MSVSTPLLRRLAGAGRLPKRPRAPNVFDHLYKYKNYGVGTTFFRKRWQKYWADPAVPDCFVTITRVKPRSRGPIRNSGKAWGVMVWKGKLFHNGEERRVKGVNKKGWFELTKEANEKLFEKVFEYQKYTKKSEVVHTGLLEPTK